MNEEKVNEIKQLAHDIPIEVGDFEWEMRRYEIASRVLATFIPDNDPYIAAKKAVLAADHLITELRRER